MKRFILLFPLLLFTAGIIYGEMPQGSLSANGPFCATGAGQLKFTSTSGIQPFTVIYNDGTADRTVTNVSSDVFFDVAISPVTSTTTYTLVSVQDSEGTTRTGGFTQGSATITINAAPEATVSGSQTICAGGTATVGAGDASASNGTIFWTEDGEGSITSGATTLTPTYTAAAADGGNTVTLTMTVTGTGACSSETASDTYVVIVDPLPVANVTGSKTICENGTATVGAGEASASNYSSILWTENGAGSITSGETTLTPTYTADAADAGNTVILTMTVTGTGTCGSATASDTYAVIVEHLPEASVSGSKTICENAAATVGAGEANASYGTIMWTENGAGSITSGATTLTPTYTAAAGDAGSTVTLTMTVTSSNSCGIATASDTYTVIVEHLPQANVTGNQTICADGTATVGAGEATAAYGTIFWTENGAGSITSGASTLTPTYTAAPADGGNVVTLTMTVTSNNACGAATASDTYTINVDPLPVANVTGSKTICENGTAAVGAGEASALYGTIFWTENGAGSITSGAATLTPVYTAAAGDAGNTVTLTMTVTSNNSCGTATASDTYPVYVEHLPLANVSGSKTICEDGTATVGAGEASASYGTIQWTENGAGSITSGATTLTPTYTAAAADAGTAVTLTMTVTSNNSCGTATASDTYTVNVNPSQTLSAVSQVAQVCSGYPAQVMLEGLIPGSIVTIHYSIAGISQPAATGNTVDGTGKTYFYTENLDAGQNGKPLTITGLTTTFPSPSCYKIFSQSFTLIVNTASTPSITGNFAPCVNSTGNIYTTEPGMTGYVWAISAGGTIEAGGGSADNTVTVTWNAATSQTVSVNYTNTSNCTAATPTVKTVNVKPLPSPLIAGIIPVCIHSGGHTYTTEKDMTSYTWSVSPGNTITSGGTGNMIVVTWDNATAPSVSVNYTDANGCRAPAPVSSPVTVNPLPVPGLTGPTAACAGSTGNVYSTDAGMSNYVWTVSAGGTITTGGGAANNSVTVTWDTPGARKVTVNYTNPATGCTASASTELPVTVNPLPLPSITGPAAPNLFTSGNVYTTEASMTGYVWNASAGGIITAGTGTNSITVTWNSPGAQSVSVNYINSNSCTATSPTVYNIIVNSLPVASGVTIHGTARSGLTLNASYAYSDADGDPQGTSLYQWYTGTSSAGADATPIPLATTTTYLLKDAQLTYYIGFSVTPVAQSGSTPGNTSTTITWAGPVINDPPSAAIQPISGSLDVNGLLTGHYVYSDTEGDIESGTLYQWYSSDNPGGPFAIIPGAQSIAHVIDNSEQGKYFRIRITPQAASGTITGSWVESPEYGPANSQPVASSVQIVSGTATVGSTLQGDYVFTDADAADLEGTSTFRWLRNGTIPIPGAVAETYLVTPEDEGYKLSFEVTPVSSSGYPDTGTPVSSAQTDPVVDTSPLTPVASQVCIEGIRAAGQILRGKYYYSFYKSEGISTFQWYRDGVAIPGANAITYTLLQVEDIDSNADITFEVTPRSSNVPEKVGTPVASNPLSRIIIPKDYFSVSESDVTLTANVSGGVFSGTGVTGNIFSPKTAGSDGSPHTLGYQYIESYAAHNCSQQASRLVYVNPNVSSFVGFDALYCHDSGPDVITVTGVPSGSTIIGFSLTDSDGLVSQSGTTATIDPGRMRPGVNNDILFFSYYDGGIFYQISKTFVIDSVGTDIRILNLNDAYCQGDAREYISIEGIYPIGGTAVWTGDILLDTKAVSAYADPTLGLPGNDYPLSYQYRSPMGCYSKILYDTVMINPLPDPSFALNPTYNINGGAIDLVPVQTGGTFSGNGVSGSKMFPDIAGLGEHEIRYSITDAEGCSSELGKKTTIRSAQGKFTGIPSVICYSDTTYTVNITELPAGVTVNSFTNTKNTLSYTAGLTYAGYNVPAAGEGPDTLNFSYKWDGVDYSISKTLLVDSIGTVGIKNLASDDLICDNMAPYELFPSKTGGIFTGPVEGSYLYPAKVLGPAEVTYTYTNSETGCSTGTSVPITIYPAPKVEFEPADYCIEDINDTTRFSNNTLSADPVEFWSWTDADGKKFSTNEEAGYLYTSGGLQKVILGAITVNGCSAQKELTFNIGVRPDADFYWKSDCMHPGDSLILRDNTKSTSPVLSRSWIHEGIEFSTAETEARLPKTDTGYVSIKYIVRTTYANCIDTVEKDIYIRPSIEILADGYFENFTSGNGGWITGDTTGSSWTFGEPAWEGVNMSASEGKAWYTNFPLLDKTVESSSIISPCYDFRTTGRPLIQLNMIRRFTRDMDGASLQYKIGDNDDWRNIGALDDGINWYNSAVIRGEPGGNQIGWTTRGEPDTAWVKSIHTLDELKNKTDVVFRIAYGSDGASRASQGLAVGDIWIGERSRNVLIEHFTSIYSEACSAANTLVNDIVAERSNDVINIQYHTNFYGDDPYYTDNQGDASARVLFYGLTRAPYTFLDGGTEKDYAYMYSYATSSTRIDSNIVTKRSLMPARFSIELLTDTGSGDLSVSGKIKALEDIDADNIALFLAVTEKENSEHTGPLGETKYYNVFRKFIPDAGGIILKNKWIKGDEQNLGELEWTIKNIANKSDIEIIAFIQNTITKEVYQASSVTYDAITVGIGDTPGAAGEGFVLYPNPAVNKLTVKFSDPLSGEADVTIIDIGGKPVREYKAGRGMTEILIDNLGLKGGIYFVRITSKGISLGHQKLVVSGD